jgi:hypothetical protein
MMRSPSRLLPKYSPERNRIVGWVAVTLLLSSIVYFGYLMFNEAPWLVVLILTLGIISHVYRTRKTQHELRALAANRTGESICEFASSFDARVVDTWVIRAVYEELQHHLAGVVSLFPIRATDLLIKELQLGDSDDLDFSVAPRIAQRTGRSMQDCTTNPYFEKVKTAGDLVLFFNSQPREEVQISNA